MCLPEYQGEYPVTGLNLFAFKPGRTPAHTLDPRCKLFLVCLLGIGLVNAGWAACAAFSAPLFFILNRLGIGMAVLFRQLKYFLVFLVFIILVRGLAIPGTPLISLFDYAVSIEGLTQGGLVALRFFMVMVLGLVFSATTRPADLKAAVQWCLAPVPFIPEKRVGVMISLALRFLPLILSQARETRQAIQARCGDRQKNPVKRTLTLTLALLGKSILSAEGLALAMAARSYTDARTDPKLVPGGKEPYAIVAGSITFTLLVFL